tara:strand:+ start:674 stop:1789 length:1116 start_codon:yes stop_codon:yes gene_type:complete
MTKARELADLIANVNKGSSLGNKNFIINGKFDVAQRGSSIAGIENYTLDRWKIDRQNVDNCAATVTQSTDVPSGQGFMNALRIDITTAESALAADETLQFEHIIESQNLQPLCHGTSNAKPITLSFWVKSNVTGTYCVSIYHYDGNDMINAQYTISSANTWEYKSMTFVGNTDSGAVIADDNTHGLKFNFILAAGSNFTGTQTATWQTYANAQFAGGQTANIMSSTDNDWAITGVQLEIGEKATEFEHEPYEATLEKCHRYYEAHTLNSYTNIGFSYSTTQFIIPYHWKVEKRASPTFSFPTVGTSSGNLGVTVGTGSYPSTHGSVLRGSAQPTQGYIYNNAGDGYAGLTDDQICILYGYNAPILALDAEL